MQPVYHQAAQDVPSVGTYEVVVCGGGPAGCMAAIAAARLGARTQLIEKYGFLGGMATAGLVGPISKFNFDGARIVGGIPLEFCQAMAALNGAILNLPSGNIPFDAEVYKCVAQRMCLQAGVSLMLHSRVVGTLDEATPGRVSGVLVEGPSGRQAVHADYLIDCTGVGDVLPHTSLPWEYRAREDAQPMSLVFRLGGVDTEAITPLMAHDHTRYANQPLRAVLQAAVDRGELAQFGGPWAVHGSIMRPGMVSVNVTRCAGDATNTTSLTAAEVQLREGIMTIVRLLREASPAFADCFLIDSATQAGFREARAIKGLHIMRLDDLLSPKAFPDTVAKGGHPVDIHRKNDSGQAVTFLRQAYNIPYRSLVPYGSRNLLVAGGCIAATHEAFASIRVQAQSMALGQAAGTAAALCANQRIAVVQLDGTALRQALLSQGAIVQ